MGSSTSRDRDRVEAMEALMDIEIVQSQEERITALRKRLKEGSAARTAEREAQAARCAVSPPPRYDEVFFAGTTWLNTL